MNVVSNLLSFILDMGMDDGMWWNHMNWPWSFFMGFWGILYWGLMLVAGVLVYQDAEKRSMNGILWFILIIIPWIGIISLLVYLILRGEKSTISAHKEKAEDILKERYARGEISREEYLKIKHDLTNTDNE